jgi:hypothetical protein
MRRSLLLVLTGLAAFAIAMLALMPASVLHAWLLQPRGVEAASVTGTIWDGRWHGAVWRGHALGEMRARAAPFSLLTGAPQARVELSGAGVSGLAALRLSGQRISVSQADIALVPSRLVRLTGQTAPMLGGTLAVSGLNGAFDEDGCVTLTGEVTGARLIALEERTGVELPQLTGSLSCAGRAVGIAFSGASEQLALRGHARLDPAHAGWRVEASPLDDSVPPLLSALGFTQAGGVWSMEGQGRWSGGQ